MDRELKNIKMHEFMFQFCEFLRRILRLTPHLLCNLSENAQQNLINILISCTFYK